jgi:hypothetical protein
MAKGKSNGRSRQRKGAEPSVRREYLNACERWLRAHLKVQDNPADDATAIAAAHEREQVLAKLNSIVARLSAGHALRACVAQFRAYAKSQQAQSVSAGTRFRPGGCFKPGAPYPLPADFGLGEVLAGHADYTPAELLDASTVRELFRKIGAAEEQIKQKETKSKSGTDGAAQREETLFNRRVVELLRSALKQPSFPSTNSKKRSAAALVYLDAAGCKEARKKSKGWLRSRLVEASSQLT